jgi:hypothetical protein
MYTMELQGRFDSVTRGNDALERYLRAGHAAVRGLAPLAAREGVSVDFTLGSVPFQNGCSLGAPMSVIAGA